MNAGVSVITSENHRRLEGTYEDEVDAGLIDTATGASVVEMVGLRLIEMGMNIGGDDTEGLGTVDTGRKSTGFGARVLVADGESGRKFSGAGAPGAVGTESTHKALANAQISQDIAFIPPTEPFR